MIRSFKLRVLLLIAPLVFGLDQWTKALVRAQIPYGHGVPVIPGFFDLVHYQNTGAAFGMLADGAVWWREPFFYLISVVAITAILVLWWRSGAHERLMPIIFSLLLGGVLGNLVDRARFGSVTDFLAVHYRDVVLHLGRFTLPLDWPAFNIADSAITVSMILLVLGMLRTAPREKNAERPK